MSRTLYVHADSPVRALSGTRLHRRNRVAASRPSPRPRPNTTLPPTPPPRPQKAGDGQTEPKPDIGAAPPYDAGRTTHPLPLIPDNSPKTEAPGPLPVIPALASRPTVDRQPASGPGRFSPPPTHHPPPPPTTHPRRVARPRPRPQTANDGPNRTQKPASTTLRFPDDSPKTILTERYPPSPGSPHRPPANPLIETASRPRRFHQHPRPAFSSLNTPGPTPPSPAPPPRMPNPKPPAEDDQIEPKPASAPPRHTKPAT